MQEIALSVFLLSPYPSIRDFSENHNNIFGTAQLISSAQVLFVLNWKYEYRESVYLVVTMNKPFCNLKA